MQPDVVIAGHEHLQTLSALRNSLVSSDVNVLLFQRPPETFHEYVVVGPALAVHGKLCRTAFPGEDVRKLLRRVLAALIRIEHFRPAVRVDRFAHGLLAEVRRERGQKPPRQDSSAVPVDDRGQVCETVLEPYVGNVRTPYLIHVGNRDIAKQVRKLPVHRIGCRFD